HTHPFTMKSSQFFAIFVIFSLLISSILATITIEISVEGDKDEDHYKCYNCRKYYRGRKAYYSNNYPYYRNGYGRRYGSYGRGRYSQHGYPRRGMYSEEEKRK